jgi:hypothetical protein
MDDLKKIPKWPAILVIIGLVLYSWYLYEDSLWIKLDNQYIEKIKCGSKRVQVVIKEKDQLSKICDLTVFNGIRPVSSLHEAIESYGEPDNYIPEKNGIQKLEYWFDNCRVDVVQQMTATDDLSLTICAFPNNLLFNKLLDNEIAERINENREKTIVVISDTNDDLLMVITLKGSRVDEIAW